MRSLEASNSDLKTFTYQTRIKDTNLLLEEFLAEYACLYGTIERKLFADYCRGLNIQKQKSAYLKTYGITARQFNAVRIILHGKIDSINALAADYITETKSRIKKVQTDIKYLQHKEHKTERQANKLHQKQRLLVRLNMKLKTLSDDKQHKRIRLCFGSKKLFKEQFNLAENNYANHAEWRSAWLVSRSNQFYLIGSKDETMGNQSCVALINATTNTIDLKLRVPDCLQGKYGKYILIANLNFAHGQTEILAAINSNITRSTYAKKSQIAVHANLYQQYGRAINYRLLRDAKGWRVFVTCDKQQDKIISDKNLGAIGIDINIDHLAVSEINRHGNLVHSFKISTCIYGKTNSQAKAIIGDAIKIVVDIAATKHKPIVIEKLDFTKKKQELAFNNNKRRNRQLSSFAYAAIIKNILARAFKCAVEVYQVNPAYTSVIGRVKFARIYTISVHQAAAMVIARRIYGFSERLPHCWDNIPNDTGGHLTLSELVKIPSRHVWHSWAKVRKNLQAALKVHYQMFIQRAICQIDLTDQPAF